MAMSLISIGLLCAYIATVTVTHCTTNTAVIHDACYTYVQVYIASCEDLQIRVYCPNFEVLQGVPMPSSVLCLLYLEESDELLAGGVGQLHTWNFHPQQKSMLTRTTSFTTTIKPQQVLFSSWMHCMSMYYAYVCVHILHVHISTVQSGIVYVFSQTLYLLTECT